MTDDLILSLVGILAGASVLAFAIAFRLGHFRDKGRWYFDEDKPAMLRNGPILSLAGGPFLLISGTLIGLGTQEATSVVRVMTAIASATWFASGALAWIWSFRPPEWSKPQWIRDAERELGSGEQSDAGGAHETGH